MADWRYGATSAALNEAAIAMAGRIQIGERVLAHRRSYCAAAYGQCRPDSASMRLPRQSERAPTGEHMPEKDLTILAVGAAGRLAGLEGLAGSGGFPLRYVAPASRWRSRQHASACRAPCSWARSRGPWPRRSLPTHPRSTMCVCGLSVSQWSTATQSQLCLQIHLHAPHQLAREAAQVFQLDRILR